MDGMRLELVKEIRDMKNGLQSSFTSMTQSILEMNSTLKQTLNQLKKDKGIEDEETPAGDITKCPYSGQIISSSLKKQIDSEIKQEGDKQKEEVKIDFPANSEAIDKQVTIVEHVEPLT